MEIESLDDEEQLLSSNEANVDESKNIDSLQNENDVEVLKLDIDPEKTIVVNGPIVDENNQIEELFIEEKKPKKEKKNKKNRSNYLLFFLIIVIILVGIYFFLFKGVGKQVKTKEIKNNIKEVTSEYMMSGNSLEKFDLSFLKLENDAKNKVYSPLSIKYALSMLSDGTSGNSKAQIDAVIGKYIAKKYQNDDNMSFANALFVKNSFKDNIMLDYTNKLSNDYNAEVIFDSFVSADNLNNWVRNKTFNMINDLFDDDITKQDFVLVNVLAIDMEWKKIIQADPDHYSDRFNVSYNHEKYSHYIDILDTSNYKKIKFNNNTIDVNTVEIGADINNYDIVKSIGENNIKSVVGAEYDKWLKDPNACNNGALEKDVYLNNYIKEINENYKKVNASTDFMIYNDESIKVFAKDLKNYNGLTLQYIGIMPKRESLNNYIKEIRVSDLNKIISNLKSIKSDSFKDGVLTRIIGNIPLFKFDYELDLMKDLQYMGINDVFDINKADLSKMVGDNKEVIDSVSHKANIEFSNNGIKASAATQVGGAGSASCGFDYLYDIPIETIDMTFNNPYMFIIRNKTSGEVWFTGTVYEPLS